MQEENFHNEENELEIEEPVKQFSILKALFYIIPVALILSVGGYFILSDEEQVIVAENNELVTVNTAGAPAEEKPQVKDGESMFIEMDPITVNLRRAGSRQQRYLKLTVRFEVKKYDHKEILENIMPRVRDQFQVFLRELRVEDLEGSTGAYRIREELLHRVNIVARPAVVTDILFDELLVQ